MYKVLCEFLLYVILHIILKYSPKGEGVHPSKGLEINDLVKKAVSDITEYAKALDLYAYLNDLRGNKEGFSSNVDIERVVSADNAGVVRMTKSRIKDGNKTVEGELVIEYKCANAIAYRIGSNRYVNLNKAMEITSEMTGTEAVCKYIEMYSSDPLAKKYYESRKHLIPLVNALYGSPRLANFINELKQEAENNKAKNAENIGKIAVMLSEINKLEPTTIEKEIINGAYINALQGFERQLVTDWMETFGTKDEPERMKQIQNDIEKKDVSKTLQKILWIIQKSGYKILRKNAPYYYYIKNCVLEKKVLKKPKNDRVAFKITNEQGESIGRQIDKTQKAQEIQKECKYITYKGHVIDFPEVLVARMDDTEIKQNKVLCSTEMQQQNENKDTKKYQLVSTVNRDLKTGEIYAVKRTGKDQWTRMDTGEQVEFFDKADNISRSVAIYEREN